MHDFKKGYRTRLCMYATTPSGFSFERSGTLQAHSVSDGNDLLAHSKIGTKHKLPIENQQQLDECYV